RRHRARRRSGGCGGWGGGRWIRRLSHGRRGRDSAREGREHEERTHAEQLGARRGARGSLGAGRPEGHEPGACPRSDREPDRRQVSGESTRTRSIMATNLPGEVTSRGGFEWAPAEQANAFLSAVYGWMGVGLVITAATAWWVAASPTVMGTILSSRGLLWALLIAQLVIVSVLSATVQQLSAGTASILFIVYSAMTGATLSVVLLAFTGESVATTFLVTAGMFLALAAYGTITKRSLGGFGQFLF